MRAPRARVHLPGSRGEHRAPALGGRARRPARFGLHLPGVRTAPSFIRARLSPQKTPTIWQWVDDFPMTGSGKIQKFALAEAFMRGDYAGAGR